MNPRSKYKTKQGQALLRFLETVPGAHLTAADVCRQLREQGVAMGQSTVYRQLESLVDEGVVNKYVLDGSSSACFEYVGADSHGDGEVCFHCKCEKCGKVIHLHCDALERVQQHLREHHQFTIDPMRAVFYGLCDECK